MIITASDKEFERFVRGLCDSALKHGHEIKVFDLGDLGFGKKFAFDSSGLKDGLTIDGLTYLPKCQFKPSLIKHALTEDIIWLDSDTWIQKPIKVEGDYDVAVTLRRPEERNIDQFSHVSGYLNAGVIFFKNTPQAHKFVDMWIDELSQTTTGSDQEALNRVVMKATDLTQYGDFNLDDIKIKVLPTDIYNNHYFKENQSEAQILHFKGNNKKLYGQVTGN